MSEQEKDHAMHAVEDETADKDVDTLHENKKVEKEESEHEEEQGAESPVNHNHGQKLDGSDDEEGFASSSEQLHEHTDEFQSPGDSKEEMAAVVDNEEVDDRGDEFDFDDDDDDDGPAPPLHTEPLDNDNSDEVQDEDTALPELQEAAPIPEPTITVDSADGDDDSADGDESKKDKEDGSPVIAAPPPMPPRENMADQHPPALPPRKRAPFFWLKTLSKSPNSSPSSNLSKSRSGSVGSPDYDLLLSRLDANSEKLEQRDSADKDASLTGIKQLQESFAELKEEQREDHEDIDWETWSSVVNDYSNFARNHPDELARAIASGFPAELRGLIWQLITSSKSAALEEIYQSIHGEPSPHEKAIKRDLSRTSFIQESQMDPLFRIIKAYSLFDPEVGYTQGMAFITVPLLIHLTEPEAFCLLVNLMKDYGMRQFFSAEMPGLHLRLYQFDRILEDTLPDVHIHLARQGVRSSMYASQWFLTLFAYKFPLPMVLRIMDIVIAEGIESLLRFAVALMRRNADAILELEFDQVLPFLKENIFDAYVVDTTQQGEAQYSVGQLVTDAFQVKILPVTLRKYQNEYSEIHRIERERVEEVENLRGTNGQLTMQVRRLETSLAALNQEHIQVANEMVQGKLEVARLQDENEQMASELEEMRAAQSDGRSLADQELREEMEQLKLTNEELTTGKTQLEEQLGTLEKDLVDTKMKLATLDDSHSTLQTRWNELRKHIEGFSAASQ